MVYVVVLKELEYVNLFVYSSGDPKIQQVKNDRK